MRGRAVVGIALLALAVSAATPARAGSPRVSYVLHCMGCHLADGGATPGRIPALAGSVGRFLHVPGGRAFLVRVPGVAHSPLEDAELAELLNWVLLRFSAEEMPSDFAPYTAAEVAAWRRQPLPDVERVRRRLIEALEREESR
jgi:hypothetical protein